MVIEMRGGEIAESGLLGSVTNGEGRKTKAQKETLQLTLFLVGGAAYRNSTQVRPNYGPKYGPK